MGLNGSPCAPPKANLAPTEAKPEYPQQISSTYQNGGVQCHDIWQSGSLVTSLVLVKVQVHDWGWISRSTASTELNAGISFSGDLRFRV